MFVFVEVAFGRRCMVGFFLIKVILQSFQEEKFLGGFFRISLLDPYLAQNQHSNWKMGAQWMTFVKRQKHLRGPVCLVFAGCIWRRCYFDEHICCCLKWWSILNLDEDGLPKLTKNPLVCSFDIHSLPKFGSSAHEKWCKRKTILSLHFWEFEDFHVALDVKLWSKPTRPTPCRCKSPGSCSIDANRMRRMGNFSCTSTWVTL